ncbi:hypothetical protein QJQ45_000512 [Haematococcus lacustris]|nr:hypothetical protein QJQ45_000512 [Haematococcus lacustris]
MQRNRHRKRNRDASDIEVDRELEAQPEPSQAQKNKKASGEARRDRHYKNTWHAKKSKRHTVMRGVCAAGLEAGVVVASEVVEARLVTQLEAWAEACSMRALLGSLLLGLAVRGWFTRARVLPDGQEVFEEIPAEDAVIPNVADRNMYLQLCRAKHSKRTKAEQAAEPTQPTKDEGKAKGEAAKAKPAPQPGRWLDRDCNAALNMQRNEESNRSPLELCWRPDLAMLPAKGKDS